MINRLSHSRLGNISFIALVMISYFVMSERSSIMTKYDIVSRAIKLISPRLSYDNLYIYTNIYIYVTKSFFKDKICYEKFLQRNVSRKEFHVSELLA